MLPWASVSAMNAPSVVAALGVVLGGVIAAACLVLLLSNGNPGARLTTALRVLAALLGNLIADAAQIEAALGTVGTIAGVVLAASGGNPQAVRIAGAVLSAVSVLTVAVPKAVAAAKTAETDLEAALRLLGK
jgi:hypothetical protein